MITKKEESIFQNHYYKVGNFWKGYGAINKLSNSSGIDEETTEKWLKKQALWQIYLPAPKDIPRPHWEINKRNEIHQSDLLFLSHDKVGKKIYKYLLVVIDIFSRLKDGEALTSKKFHQHLLKFIQEN